MLDKRLEYVYNGIGNIMSVTTYAYTPKGTEPTGNGTTNTLQYNDTSHPDRLTKCGYKNIGYNAIGYPVTYGSMHFDWENGKLAKYYEEEDPDGFSSSESTEFTYNAFGDRIRKEYSYYPGEDYSGDFPIGKEANYDYDHSGRLIREISTEYFTESASETIELVFLYDESGMIGFTHSRNGSTPLAYYYQRNLQGDVVAIYNTDGDKVAGYAYDAYGNCTASGSMAQINPIRYRGYYWDSETNWYYLNARYYSPEWRRFISPDDTAYLDPESVNGLNLYCYCNNDPINFVDPSGHVVIAAIIFGGAIGFALGFGFSVAGQYAASNGDWNKVNLWMAAYDGLWGAVNGVLAATSITTPLAVLAGAAMGGISSVGSDLIFNNGNINWDGVIINTVLGGVAGLIAGSGSGVTIDKYVHSKDILNRTIANGTTRAIGRQISVMYKHILPLVDSGIRYILGNGFGTITSKGITVT